MSDATPRYHLAVAGVVTVPTNPGATVTAVWTPQIACWLHLDLLAVHPPRLWEIVTLHVGWRAVDHLPVARPPLGPFTAREYVAPGTPVTLTLRNRSRRRLCAKVVFGFEVRVLPAPIKQK